MNYINQIRNNAISRLNSSTVYKNALVLFYSDNIYSKIAFLILILILLYIALKTIINFIYWLFSPSSSPVLINGMMPGSETAVFHQDPSLENSVYIKRSDNDKTGVEFTWSCWLYIESPSTSPNQYTHIFSKGTNKMSSDGSGLMYPNNAPGVYLKNNTGNQAVLTIIINSFNTINNVIDIPNIPLKKWFNLIIRCEGNVIDVFINGTIKQSIHLDSVVKQNYGDVYVFMDGKFNGHISSLRYYDHSIGTKKFSSLLYSGPNTKLIGGVNGLNLSVSNNYLSPFWYY